MSQEVVACPQELCTCVCITFRPEAGVPVSNVTAITITYTVIIAWDVFY